jgi:hypothetical protein
MRPNPPRASTHSGRGRAPRRSWWAPAPRWSTTALAAWRAVVLVAALPGVAGASPPCGQPGLIGLASTAEVTAAGDLVASLTLTDAAVASLSVLPLVFVDGLVVDAGGPLALSCGEEVAWSVPAGRIGRVEHAVHWTVLPWPPVAPAVAALDADEALARYVDRSPPGLYPWSDVALLRPPGATPWRRAASAGGTGAGGPDASNPPSGPVDDAVEWVVRGENGRPVRLVRAPVGATQRFMLRYLPSQRGGGPMVATCLLDDRQVLAFDGRPIVHVEAETGRLVALEGTVVVPGPGWHRLQCLLLPDDHGERPLAWPRPLVAAYLWGDP